MRTELAQPIRLQDYRAPDWTIEKVDLDISLDPSKTRVKSRLTISPAGECLSRPVEARRRRPQFRRLEDRWPGNCRQFLHSDARRTHHPAAAAAALCASKSKAVDPSANTQLMGLYRSSGTYCTQCEAEGFRRITYFLDRPDVMAVYTTRIEAERNEAPICWPMAI